MLDVFEALGNAFGLVDTTLEFVLGRRRGKLDYQEQQDAEFMREIVDYLPESFVETLSIPMSASRFPSAMFDTLYEFHYSIGADPQAGFYDRELDDRYRELVAVIDAYTDFLTEATPLGDGYHSIFNDPMAVGFDDDPDADADVESEFQEGHYQIAEGYKDLLLTAREKCLAWAD